MGYVITVVSDRFASSNGFVLFFGVRYEKLKMMRTFEMKSSTSATVGNSFSFFSFQHNSPAVIFSVRQQHFQFFFETMKKQTERMCKVKEFSRINVGRSI